MIISRTQVKLMNTGEAHEYMRWQMQQHLANIADACITTEAHDVYTHSRSLWTQSKLTNTREVHEHMTVLQHMRDSPMQQKVTRLARCGRKTKPRCDYSKSQATRLLESASPKMYSWSDSSSSSEKACSSPAPSMSSEDNDEYPRSNTSFPFSSPTGRKSVRRSLPYK